MLVLSRQPGHAVLFTGGIRVVILECSKRSVRIGIEAPAAVGILREEVAQRNAAEGSDPQPRPPRSEAPAEPLSEPDDGV
jgi:carbon storage regulator CsrA